MEFSLVEVDEQDYVLVQNMIRFYIYDMSEFTGWGCPSNGLYGGVDDLPYYFGKIPEDPNDRWPEGWTGKGFKIVGGGRDRRLLFGAILHRRNHANKRYRRVLHRPEVAGKGTW